MSTWDRFWANPNTLPGMLELGAGAYGAFGGRNEANKKVDAAQGPLYQAATAQAQGMLSRSTDPSVQAKQRFNSELGLLRDEDAASEAALMRNLQKRGMIDVATYDVDGKQMN